MKIYIDIIPDQMTKKEFDSVFDDMVYSKHFNTKHIKWINRIAPEYWNFFFKELKKETIQTLFQNQKWYFDFIYEVGDIESFSDEDRKKIADLFTYLRNKYQ